MRFRDAKNTVINLYPNSTAWRYEVEHMKPRQVFAILKNASKKNPEKVAYAKQNCRQMSMFDMDIFKEKEEWHQITIGEYLSSLKEAK